MSERDKLVMGSTPVGLRCPSGTCRSVPKRRAAFGPGTAQQTVSIGTRLEVVVVVLFVQVLFVIDSPIEGSPCDELECCGPCVVFVNERPVFEFHKRFMAAQTYEEEIGGKTRWPQGGEKRRKNGNSYKL
uniref:Uncharacterized protein n=1 Tax=Anopheles merus TaxID=30066 RepID=A0A182ULN3_ANOME